MRRKLRQHRHRDVIGSCLRSRKLFGCSLYERSCHMMVGEYLEAGGTKRILCIHVLFSCFILLPRNNFDIQIKYLIHFSFRVSCPTLARFVQDFALLFPRQFLFNLEILVYLYLQLPYFYSAVPKIFDCLGNNYQYLSNASAYVPPFVCFMISTLLAAC